MDQTIYADSPEALDIDVVYLDGSRVDYVVALNQAEKWVECVYVKPSDDGIDWSEVTTDGKLRTIRLEGQVTLSRKSEILTAE